MAASQPADRSATGLPDILAPSWFNVKAPLSWPELKGRPVLVEIWATWCPVCLESIPKLNGLQARYADRGLVVIGVTSDAPLKVAAFVKRYNMRYAVAAGQTPDKNKNVRAIPHCFLISPRGELAWEGAAAGVQRPLAKLMSEVKPRGAQDLIALGAIFGCNPVRPPSAASYDSAALKIKADAVLGRGASASTEDLNELYRFYWQNLPQSGWRGDADVRIEANQQLYDLWLTVKNSRNPAVPDSLRAEMVRRLGGAEDDSNNRSLISRFAGHFWVGRADKRVIQLLESQCRTERNPGVLLDAEEALDRVVLGRLPKPPSLLDTAQHNYGREKSSWKARVLGVSKEWEPYERHCEAMQRLLASDMPASEILKRLASEYAACRPDREWDALWRFSILDIAERLSEWREINPADRKWRQDWLFGLMNQPEGDWAIRNMIIATLCGGGNDVGNDCLDRQKLLEAVDRLLAREKVRSIRRFLESWRMIIINPDAFKSPR